MKRNTLLKATAFLAMIAIGLSYALLPTEYWIFAVVALALSSSWLMAFVMVNLKRIVR